MQARRAQTRWRKSTAGFTLIELTIALAIVGMMAAATVMSVNAVTDANLRSAALALSGAIKQSYDRAAMLNRTQRIAIDIDNGVWWVEYTENRYALSKERLSGSEGESAEEMQERLDEEAKKAESPSFFGSEGENQVRALVEGGMSRFFTPDEGLDAGKPQTLPGGVGFAQVWTGHQEEAFKSGLTYLHFFPSGWTEPALIEIVDEGGDIFTLEVQPLTGRVRTHDKRVDIPKLDDGDGREEGDL